jgi:hypothetical protein
MKNPNWLKQCAICALIVVAGQLAFPLVALAQDSNLAPSAALACLTRVAGAATAPVYPPDLLVRKEGDRISVELEFRSRDAAPSVTMDRQTHHRDFADEVREFVRAYRVPCMAEGAPPVVLSQQFIFSPTDGRKLVVPVLTDKNDIARQEQMKCIYHVDKAMRPQFPRTAAQREQEENLVVRLRFVDPALAPQVVFLAPPKVNSLRQSVVHYADGLRMPCLVNGPNEVDTLYKFSLLGSARTVLRDMGLSQFIGGSKDYQRPAKFDFNTMGCPFDVRLTYLRPYMPNKVREIETGNPARKPLLEWLGGMTFNFDESTNRKVLGDSMNLTIPCGTLDLPAVPTIPI